MNFTGKVLITDDEPHIRKFISLVVKRLGHPVLLEAANGEEALALYERERPDLVLLDVNMPVLDGVGALGRIKAFDPDALVVMLTSLTNRQTVEACARLGALDYLRKDLPRDEMILQLTHLVQDCFGVEDAAPAPEAARP